IVKRESSMLMVNRTGDDVAVLSVALVMLSPSPWHDAVRAASATPGVAVAPQYGSTHVYVAPEDVDRFVASFLGTFGGKSSKQVVATVTPTPSRTSSQLLQTPV